MRYICTRCGVSFNEPGSRSEWIGESSYSSNNSGWLNTVVCPECGCDELKEPEECYVCGQDFDKEEMVESDGHYYCKECAGRIYDAYYLKYGYLEEAKK